MRRQALGVARGLTYHRAVLRFATATLTVLAALVATPTAVTAAEPRQETRVRDSRLLVQELLQGDPRVVPDELIEDSRCLAVFPGVVEAAFGVGGSHGLGIASCRDETGAWSAPVFLRISGGSIGLQVGFRKVDLMLFVVTEGGAESLARSSLALGGEASVAAGRLDRRAEVSTDERFEEDFYLFARARGLFAGASLEGTRLSSATEHLERYYGEFYLPGEILAGQQHPDLPAEAELWLSTLAELPE